MIARILIVAGSDSGAGAGIQADIKTVLTLGGYAMTAITALTAQNTRGVVGVHPVPTDFVRLQMEACLDDIGADAVKTGMLYSAEIVETVAEILATQAQTLPLVLDPVMVAKGGASLLDAAAVSAVRTLLIPRASMLTPNIPEAEALLGRAIGGAAAMTDAAMELLELGCDSVLLKGGHLDGEDLQDVLATRSGIEVFTGKRIAGRHTHGTGCTLASAVATGLAQGMSLCDAVKRARAFVRAAIRQAPGLGSGHGPLDHSVKPEDWR